jgi:hypothetical protein
VSLLGRRRQLASVLAFVLIGTIGMPSVGEQGVGDTGLMLDLGVNVGHFAQGKAPTPHGSISSRWRRGRGSFKLTVVAPRGTSVLVELPVIRHAHKVAVDGKVVHVKRRRGVFRFRKVRGQHTFVVR